MYRPSSNRSGLWKLRRFAGPPERRFDTNDDRVMHFPLLGKANREVEEISVSGSKGAGARFFIVITPRTHVDPAIDRSDLDDVQSQSPEEMTLLFPTLFRR
jgi:hypothetical protein